MLEMLSVAIDKGVTKQTDLLKNSSKKDSSREDKSQYKRVGAGDIAYNKMRMWQGAIGMSEFEGLVSPAYIVLSSRGRINPSFKKWLSDKVFTLTYDNPLVIQGDSAQS
jgi:type I restriction enzyme S subunit